MICVHKFSHNLGCIALCSSAKWPWELMGAIYYNFVKRANKCEKNVSIIDEKHEEKIDSVKRKVLILNIKTKDMKKSL